MLAYLSEDQFAKRTVSRNRKYWGLDPGPDSWRALVGTLIPKGSGVYRKPRQLRILTLFPILRKLCGALLAGRLRDMLENQGQWQFAYRKGWQAGEMVYCLGDLASKADMAGLPLVVLKIDLRQAF